MMKEPGSRKQNSKVHASSAHWYDVLRYHLVPPAFLIFFTAAAQYLAWMGRGQLKNFTWHAFWGNAISWKFVLVFFSWAYLSLIIPSRKTKGPATDFGHVPVYQDNGFLYYWASVGAFLFYNLAVDSEISTKIYDNFPYILGSLNTSAYVLCAVLLIKGWYFPEVQEKSSSKQLPVAYQFYAGKELHPRILGVDVKQMTNCRIGVMSWQTVIIAELFVSIKRHHEEGLSFNHGCLVTVLLQSIYLAKFFWWEAGYFWTLDIIYDRAGYYLCWGSLVWVPIFYAFPSYFFVAYPPQLAPRTEWLIFFVGVAAIALNYQVDREKEVFKRTNGDCTIWGSKPTFLSVEYKDEMGRLKKSKLLTSGFWGKLRHFNYTADLMTAYCWCAVAGFQYGLAPFYCALFSTALLVHRVFRDEEKCSRKYGPHWKKYCELVPYRMIPFIF